MNKRVLDPNDPDDLFEIMEIIKEETVWVEGEEINERERTSLRSFSALDLQFYSMIVFNYRKDFD
jgi:hypothetical protein